MAEAVEEAEFDEEEMESSRAKHKLEMVVILNELRHFETIKGCSLEAHCWRLKEKMKTVSVALVLCLNLPVDPPDVVKLQPCSRLEAWIDPTTMPATKAIEAIGASLQKAYERGQPKARYKISQDPTVDDIKKLCTPLRRNAKEERVLFHYNGHGVPRPTDNGEIWVFNSNYTQYIPLSIYDLQQWMGAPSVYVYDCSHAGKVVKLFKSFSNQYDDCRCLQLAACGDRELLPQNPDLPADLFTACLTTPVKMAMRFYMLQNKHRILPSLNLELLDKAFWLHYDDENQLKLSPRELRDLGRISGSLSDRRSLLGELNWIFTAITDTIAWSTLPRELFQKLFRQDLLVASLFRNFILAQRILGYFDCTPVSSPSLPATHQHHMWDAWDLAMETSLAQVPQILLIVEPMNMYQASPFFDDQLTAFQVWLTLGSVKRPPPEQLPVVLQVLLSQVYRPRALDLLGTFLGLGPWAVNLVLEVGIFPYILKLLQSTAKELRPLLTLLWAKILAVDSTCKADLMKENGNRYFINILKDCLMPPEYRTMASFVLCTLVTNNRKGQIATLQGHLLPACLELLLDPHPPMRQWAALCAGRTWETLPMARWEATRDNGHEKLSELLADPVPEVRAAAVFALGTFIQSLSITDDSDQGRSINFNIGVNLVDRVEVEASPLVRRELVVALHYLVLTYEHTFCEITKEYYAATYTSSSTPSKDFRSPQNSRLSSSSSLSRLSTDSPRSSKTGVSSASSSSDVSIVASPTPARKDSFQSPVSFTGGTRLSYGRINLKIWTAFVTLEKDPHPYVSDPAQEVVMYFQKKLLDDVKPDKTVFGRENIRKYAVPVTRGSATTLPVMKEMDFIMPIVGSNMVEWCAIVFTKSAESQKEDSPTAKDLVSYEKPFPSVHTDLKVDPSQILTSQRFEEQLFLHRMTMPPSVLLFHPSEPLLMVAEKRGVTVWDVETSSKKHEFKNGNEGPNQITSMVFLNSLTESPYLGIGCNDGSVRVWRECFNAPFPPKLPTNPHSQRALNRSLIKDEELPKPAKLVTAFQALHDVGPSKRGGGLLMSWEQTERTMIVAGDAKVIRLWDVTKEMFMRDIQTESTCTTALDSQQGCPWIVAGFSDGYVRLFDRRISSAIARQWRDKNCCVLMTQLINPSSSATQIISGIDTGEVRVHDLRRTATMPIRMQLPENMKALTMRYNPKARIFATGSLNHQIFIAHSSLPRINSIRHYSGFVGHKIGPVSCFSFHPTKMQFAAGTTDGTVSIHALAKR